MLTALTAFDGETILPLAEAKEHLRLTDSDTYHEASVEDARDDAIAWFENYASVSLEERQFEWTEESFACRMRFPRRPVESVDSIDYYDAAGTDIALVEADWYVGDNELSAAAGTSWPCSSGQPGSVRVTFTAGYAAPADIPLDALRAVKLALTAYFEDRSNPNLTVAELHANRFRMMAA